MPTTDEIALMKSKARATPTPGAPGYRPGHADKMEQDHQAGKVLGDALDENGEPHAPFFRNLAHVFRRFAGHESERGWFLAPTGARATVVGGPGPGGWSLTPANNPRGDHAVLVHHGPILPTGVLRNPLHAAIMDKAALHEWASHPDIPPTLRAAIVNHAEALPEAPTKLNRPELTAGMHESLQNPTDHLSRSVYADALQDAGHDAHADRVRWWAGAVKHLMEHPHASASRTFGSHALPMWVQMLGANHDDWRAHPHRTDLSALHHRNELVLLGVEPAVSDAHTAAIANVARQAMPPHGNDPHARQAVIGAVATRSGHAQRTFPGPLHGHTLESLAEYAERNPPPAQEHSLPPVKLSRVGDWVRGWFGKKEPVRDRKDGIAHTHASDPTAAYTEHNTIAQAMRLLGATNHADPAHVALHADAVAKIVKAKPDLPMVKAYLEKAKVLGGTAGPELTEAAKPLVSAANMLLHVAGKTQRFVKPTPQGAPRPLPSSTAEPEHAAVEAAKPIELETEPTAEPTEDRHTAILRMKKAGADNESIIQHIVDVHGAPTRKAAQASIRAAFTRAIALHQKAKQGKGPTKLAAYPGGRIDPGHLVGKTAARDPLTNANRGFARGIDGTALAFHLRQIASDHPDLQAATEAALTNRSHGVAVGKDPFEFIGTSLKRRGHALADAYNWRQIADGLRQDAHVQDFVRRHVGHPTHLDDHEYWGAVNRQFGKGSHKQVEEFWRRFEREHGGKITREQATESIFRLRDRALDREYLSGVKGKGGDKQQWRETMGEAPQAKHLKFSREKGWRNG